MKIVLHLTNKRIKYMADYVANENVNEEESSAFNLTAIWKIIVLNWQWIIVSTIVALVLLRTKQDEFARAIARGITDFEQEADRL